MTDDLETPEPHHEKQGKKVKVNGPLSSHEEAESNRAVSPQLKVVFLSKLERDELLRLEKDIRL